MISDICDTHLHVFGAAERYPLAPGSRYVPPVVSTADHLALFRARGIGRLVLVQPSCYGADNRCMLDALAGVGVPARAVVAVAPDVSEGELQRMHQLGVRGIRVNAVGGSTLTIAQLAGIAPMLRALGWHVQTFVPKGTLAQYAEPLLATGVDVVLDHFGSPDPGLGLEQPTQQVLARMLDTGRCWVKVSAPFRISASPAPYADMVPFAHWLVGQRADRLVWGSDWPYIHFIDKLAADYDPVAWLTEAIDDAATRQAVFCSNSRILYGFE